MPTVERTIRDSFLKFTKNHTPPGLVACEKHSWEIDEWWTEPVIRLELPGFSFGPFCRRRTVATVCDSSLSGIGTKIFVYDPSWLPEAEKLAAEYERYSGKKVVVDIFR